MQYLVFARMSTLIRVRNGEMSKSETVSTIVKHVCQEKVVNAHKCLVNQWEFENSWSVNPRSKLCNYMAMVT